MILNQCRIPDPVPPAGDAVLRGVPGFYSATNATHAGTQYRLGAPISAAAGMYKMCWCRPRYVYDAIAERDVVTCTRCANNCTKNDDFAVEVGDITIVAPALNHLRQCYYNMPCTIEVEGTNLADGDVVHVLAYCPDPAVWRGSANPVDAIPGNVFLQGWPRKGLSFNATNDGKTISWGFDGIKTPIGAYTLCWCMKAGVGSGHRCEKPQDFYVNIGEIVVSGPLAGQSFRSVAGHPASFTGAQGYGFKETDELAIVEFAENCTSPVSIVRAAAAMSGFPLDGIATILQKPFPPTGGSNRIKTMDFSWGAARVERGGEEFVLCWYPYQEIGMAAPVPQILGTLQLDGPRGDQLFLQPAGLQLNIQSLLGTGLASGDRLVATKSGCGASNAITLLGGYGISYATTDGTSYSWPGLALAEGGKYTICWCRVLVGSDSTCRTPDDFLIFAGEMVLVGPLLHHSFTCFSGRDCDIVIEWPAEVSPRSGYVLVSSSASCTGENHKGFPRFATAGTTQFRWSSIFATAGEFAACWCLAPGCTKPADFMHQIGTIEVKGPNSGHTFQCLWRQSCTVAPISGTNMLNGQALLYTSRSSCADSPMTTTTTIITTTSLHNGSTTSTSTTTSTTVASYIDSVDETGSNETEIGVIATPSTHCKDYYIGCTHSWGADAMGWLFAVPYLATGYRLCWCHSMNCTISEYVVDVGTLHVGGHPPLPWTLKANPVLAM